MDFPLRAIPSRMFAGIDSFVLLAAPFYILTGELMSRSGITERLIALSMLLTRTLRAGTAYAAVVTALFFSGISGTAVGDAAALGQIFIRQMNKEGYQTRESAGPDRRRLDPRPDHPALRHHGDLRLARAGLDDRPLHRRLRPGPPDRARPLPLSSGSQARRWRHALSAGRARAARALARGFRRACSIAQPAGRSSSAAASSGVFTTTEAGGIAVAYALFLGVVVLRTLTMADVWDSLKVSGRDHRLDLHDPRHLGGPFLRLHARRPRTNGSQRSASVFAGQPVLFLLAITVAFLLIGTFLEPGPALILFVPMLLPVVTALGIDPIQFAMVVIVVLNLGLITPPVGVVMFVVGRIAQLDMWELFRGIWPYPRLPGGRRRPALPFPGPVDLAAGGCEVDEDRAASRPCGLQNFRNCSGSRSRPSDGLTGLGETFFAPGAVEAFIHEYAAPALLGDDPRDVDRHAHRSGSVYVGSQDSGAEMRAASAIDLALWDILGQKPVGAGLAADRRQSARFDVPVYNTCAGYTHARATKRHALFERNEDWTPHGRRRSDWRRRKGPTRISTRSASEPADLASSLLSEGIGAMKIWPFDVAAEASNGARITGAEIERRLAARPRHPRGGRRRDRDHDRAARSLDVALRHAGSRGRWSRSGPPGSRSRSAATTRARSPRLRATPAIPICASERLATRAGFKRSARTRRRLRRDDRRRLVRRPRRGAPHRGHGRRLARARYPARLHRPGRLRRLLRAVGHPAARELAGDGPGLCARLVPRDRHRPAASDGRQRFALGGSGARAEIAPGNPVAPRRDSRREFGLSGATCCCAEGSVPTSLRDAAVIFEAKLSRACRVDLTGVLDRARISARSVPDCTVTKYVARTQAPELTERSL